MRLSNQAIMDLRSYWKELRTAHGKAAAGLKDMFHKAYESSDLVVADKKLFRVLGMLAFNKELRVELSSIDPMECKMQILENEGFLKLVVGVGALSKEEIPLRPESLNEFLKTTTKE